MTDFSESSHRQLRQQLSTCLEAIISMQLVPRAGGEGMIAAVEILRRSPQISKLILEGEFERLDEELESSVTYYKMQSMNQSLAALVVHGAITHETAKLASSNPGDLELLLRKIVGAMHDGDEPQGDAMAEPTSDFSKILELAEVKKHYDELQVRHGEELADRDRRIAELVTQLNQLPDKSPGDDRASQLASENERLTEQIRTAQADYESKLERLNRRVRELSAKASEEPAADTGRKGFFRR